MTGEELQAAREARAATLRPAEVDAAGLRALVENLGFATPAELVGWSAAAVDLLEPELAALRVIELGLWPGERRYCARELLRYAYVCVGDRHPKKEYNKQAASGKLSWLAAEVYELLLEAEQRASALELRDLVGAERTSVLSIERALQELGATLKVLRTGRSASGEPAWRATVKALPEVAGAFERVSLVQSAAALVTKRLDVVVWESEEELARALAPLHSRSRVHAALSGLEVAREVVAETVEGRPGWRLKN